MQVDLRRHTAETHFWIVSTYLHTHTYSQIYIQNENDFYFFIAFLICFSKKFSKSAYIGGGGRIKVLENLLTVAKSLCIQSGENMPLTTIK